MRIYDLDPDFQTSIGCLTHLDQFLNESWAGYLDDTFHP